MCNFFSFTEPLFQKRDSEILKKSETTTSLLGHKNKINLIKMDRLIMKFCLVKISIHYKQNFLNGFH